MSVGEKPTSAALGESRGRMGSGVVNSEAAVAWLLLCVHGEERIEAGQAKVVREAEGR